MVSRFWGGGFIHLNGCIVKTFPKIEQALGVAELSRKREARVNGFHFKDLHKRCQTSGKVYRQLASHIWNSEVESENHQCIDDSGAMGPVRAPRKQTREKG